KTWNPFLGERNELLGWDVARKRPDPIFEAEWREPFEMIDVKQDGPTWPDIVEQAFDRLPGIGGVLGHPPAEDDVDLVAIDRDVEQVGPSRNEIGSAKRDIGVDRAWIDRDHRRAHIDEIIGKPAGAGTYFQDRLSRKHIRLTQCEIVKVLVARF